MRIVHCMRHMLLEHGGVVRAVLDICAVLASAGHDVELWCIDDKDVPEPWKRGEPGCPRVRRLPRPGLPGAMFTAAQLREIGGMMTGADVVHLHSVWHISNMQIASRCRASGVPYVVSIHGMLDDWSMAQRRTKKKLFLGVGGRSMMERASFVHCTAQAEMDQSKKWYPRGRGRVIPLVFDVSPFRVMPGRGPAERKFAALTRGRPNVLFLSRLHYKKGVEHLIRAAEILRGRGVSITVLVAGSGDREYEQRLRSLVSELNLSETVEFLGMVSGVEKISLYEASDVVALPTSQENFGFVVFEALASGRPLITTSGVDTWPEIEASGGGLIVAQEAGAIAEAIEGLLSDPERRAKMGASGREWVLRELDPARVVERFVAMYAEAAGSAPTRS